MLGMPKRLSPFFVDFPDKIKDTLGAKWFWTGNNRNEDVAYGIHPSYNLIDGGYHSAERTVLCTN